MISLQTEPDLWLPSISISCRVAITDSILHVTNSVISSSLSNECNVSETLSNSHSQSLRISCLVIEQAITAKRDVIKQNSACKIYVKYCNRLLTMVFGVEFDTVLVSCRKYCRLYRRVMMTVPWTCCHDLCGVATRNRLKSLRFPFNHNFILFNLVLQYFSFSYLLTRTH